MHLLIPLIASFLFVSSLICVKRVANPRAGVIGVGPITVLFFSNLSMVVGFSPMWSGADAAQPWILYWQPLALAICYILGVLFTFAAVRAGDISVATPVLGIKIVLVAMLLSTLAKQPVGTAIWVASVAAAIGVGLIQWTGRDQPKHMLFTITLALLASAFYAFFDVLNQMWAPVWGSGQILPITFWLVGLLSLAMIPWVNWGKLHDKDILFWLGWTTVLTLLHTLAIVVVIAYFGDAARVNIVLSLRGMWAVGIAWMAGSSISQSEGRLTIRNLRTRLLGASLLTVAVVLAIAYPS